MTPLPILYPGDCRDTMAALAFAGETFDAAVCDPPYDLVSVVKRFGAAGAAPAQHGRDGAFTRQSRGFMGQTWDGTGIAFDPATWRAVYDVLKPGAHLVAFGGTRTYHRMTCAIEDAGFEIRDCLMWIYGTGFPKSHDTSKAIDKAAGAERQATGSGATGATWGEGAAEGFAGAFGYRTDFARRDEPATAEAAQWQGWGTALKPAVEPVVLARKPLSGTIANNVLEHGTGALNIDGCRIGADDAPAGRVRYGGGASQATAPAMNCRTVAPPCRPVAGRRTSCTTAAARWSDCSPVVQAQRRRSAERRRATPAPAASRTAARVCPAFSTATPDRPRDSSIRPRQPKPTAPGRSIRPSNRSRSCGGCVAW